MKTKSPIVDHCRIYSEYGEMPLADHHEGYMWIVDYFDVDKNRIDSTAHWTLSEAEMSVQIRKGKNLDQFYA